MMPRYAGLDLDAAIVVLDWSGWVRRAWHASGLKVDKTAGIVAGWLAQLLSDPMPNAIVAAVDPPRRRHTGFRVPTFRHAATRHLDELEQYKANRPPATEELMAAEECLDELLRLHAIPMLEPDDPTREQTWEADDSAAAAVRLASTEGRPAILVSIDKDWMQLISTDDPTQTMVVCWDLKNDRVLDSAHVKTSFGVRPEQLADFLAICGDDGDNVKGLAGVGAVGAALVLAEFGSLEAAIEAGAGMPDPKSVNDKDERKLLRYLLKIRDGAAQARFARSLVMLWDQAPIAWSRADQMVGGFDVRGLRRLFRDFGHTRLAELVPSFPKPDWRAA